MTVSQYFTPAGRLIQTPYQNGDGDQAYYESKVALREAVEGQLAPTGGRVDARSLGLNVPDSLVYQTDGGRTVYGGGGILPDYIVPIDTVSAALRTVIGRNLDNEFARVEIERLGDGFRAEWAGRDRDFTRGFTLSDQAFERFLAFAADRGIRVVDDRGPSIDDDVLVRAEATAERADIEARIRAFMARRLFDAEAFYPVIATLDPALRQAMSLWDDAVTLAQAR